MNKQEVLEALLIEARRYEASTEEVRTWPQADIENALLEQMRDLDHIIAALRTTDTARGRAQYRQRLVRVAGAALALLVDEVEVVTGRSLDEWLAAREPKQSGVGGVVVHVNPAPVSAANMALAREAYAAGLRDGRVGR